MPPHHALTPFVALAGLLAPALAHAQNLADLSEEERGRLGDYLGQAEETYGKGDFAAALEAYEGAYSIYADPNLLYRIALCHERLGNYDEAIEAYSTYLDEVPDDPDAERIRGVIRSLEERRAPRTAQLAFTLAPADAELFIDDSQRLEPRDDAGVVRVDVPAGKHRVRVSRQGHTPQEYEVEVTAGQTYPVILSLSELPRAPERVGGYVLPGTLVGLGGVTMLAGGGFLASSLGGQAVLQAQFDARRDQARPDGYDAAAQEVSSQRQIGVILFGVGALVGAAGGVLWAIEADAERDPTAWRLTPSVGPSGATATLRTRF